MVLLREPAPGPGASGSVGNLTYSRNRFGAYARARTNPVNPNSERQVAVRTALSFLTNRWSQGLSQAQRDAWDLYGESVAMVNRLGITIFLTGFNHYLRSNVINKQHGNPVIDDGPTIFELPDQDPTMAITASEAAQQISTSYDDTLDWASETGGFLWLFQGSPQNPQRTFFNGPWRKMDVVVGVDAAPPAGPRLSTVQFAIAEAQRQWVYARIQRADGRISEPFQVEILVGA